MNEKDCIKKLNRAERKVRILEDMFEDRTRELHAKIQEKEELELFAFMSSHDLKEPLRTIKSFSEILEEDYAQSLDDEGQKIVSNIKSSAIRLTEMISGLLEYAQLGKNKSKIMLNCNIAISDIAKDLDKLISETDTTLIYKNLPTLPVYATEFRVLLQNLIQNAIKFRSKDSTPIINITAVQRKDDYLFSVIDNGIGIEPRFHESIFQVFRKLHPDSEYEGAGLGLSNCQKIVELHGGRIWVDSAVGKGSTFHFIIPG